MAADMGALSSSRHAFQMARLRTAERKMFSTNNRQETQFQMIYKLLKLMPVCFGRLIVSSATQNFRRRKLFLGEISSAFRGILQQV